MDFKNKVALITGGAGGIGKAYAEELLKLGAKTHTTSSSKDRTALVDWSGVIVNDPHFRLFFPSFQYRLISRRATPFGTIVRFGKCPVQLVQLPLVPSLDEPHSPSGDLSILVSICDLDEENGELLAQQFNHLYGHNRTIFCLCDVTDYPQFEAAFQTTSSVFGGLDIVVNNAGIFNDRFWELEVDVNLNGVIRGTLLALRFMGRDRGGRGGTVVITGSTLGLRPCACVPIYTATKHAIIGFTRSFGDPFHMNLSGVRIIALCPGSTCTENNPEDMKKGILSPAYEPVWRKEYENRPFQPVQNVGRALIHVLVKGTSGSIWTVDNQNPPREVKFTSSP